MSALSSTAEIYSSGRFAPTAVIQQLIKLSAETVSVKSCPFQPQEQTSINSASMSARCPMSGSPALFNHVGGAQKHRLRNAQSEQSQPITQYSTQSMVSRQLRFFAPSAIHFAVDGHGSFVRCKVPSG
jgi:hypothetical protein